MAATSLPAMARAVSTEVMVSPYQAVLRLLSAAQAVAFPNLDINVSVTKPQKPEYGDYQYNSAMGAFKKISKMKKDGVATTCDYKSPVEAAQAVAAALPLDDVIEKVDVVNGFVNIFVRFDWLAAQAASTLLSGMRKPEGVTPKKVVIDFSSPNIAKEMHVGHLRSTIIGESLARILEFCGHNVDRTNHIGDWGTQFGMLITHLQDNHPDFLSTPPAINDLEAFYVEAKTRFNDDEAFKTRAREMVTRLQSGDEMALAAWRIVVAASREKFDEIYRRLDITVHEKGESFYNDLLPSVVTWLEGAGIIEDNEGAKCVNVPNPRYPKAAMVPLFIQKSDGGYGYATTDMAAIRYRIQDLGAEMIFYVVDAGQNDHFERIFETARRVGLLTPAHRVEHIFFGLVMGEDGKRFRTSAGGSVKLKDLLDEAVRGAAAVHDEKVKELEDKGTPEQRAQIAETIGIGCVKYADLHCHRESNYLFSFERMLDQKGNTAVYLLYGYARIQSIKAKSGFKIEDLIANDLDKLQFVADEERKIASLISTFPDVVLKTQEDMTPHVLCDFMYALASLFSDFYTNCRVIDPENVDTMKSRLLICEIVSRALAKSFDLLGIRYIDHI